MPSRPSTGLQGSTIHAFPDVLAGSEAEQPGCAAALLQDAGVVIGA